MASGRRRLVWVAWGLGIGVVAIWFALGPLQTFSMTGHFFLIHRVEPLVSPVAVAAIEEGGLRLADGRLASLKGIVKLKTDSAVLAEAVRDGVEIAQNGRLFGRVRVWHWCGNDPVREDVRRVDLALLVIYMHGDGAGGRPGSAEMGRGDVEEDERVGEWGWNISSALDYFGWLQLRELEAGG